MAADLQRQVAPIRSPIGLSGEHDPSENRHDSFDAIADSPSAHMWRTMM